MQPLPVFQLNQIPAAAEFGMERESLRITENGALAQTPHPFPKHRNIDRDFCENQIEIISDVFTDPDALLAQQNALLDEISARLQEQNELLWPFSNPPRFSGEDEIPVAQFTGTQQNKSAYREYLAQKYGKKKMLFSGIHLNFSFAPGAIDALFAQSGFAQLRAFKDALYLRLAKHLTAYCPLLVYLTAANPVADSSLGVDNNCYSSVRCGAKGYWNSFVPLLDYTSPEGYVQSIEQYIRSGSLQSVSELYYPVRLKPRGANSLDALRENGINHLELRIFDVNPLTRTGIFREDIRFVQLLMLYFLSLPDFDFDPQRQLAAIEGVKAAALYDNDAVRRQAERVLRSITAFAKAHYPSLLSAAVYQQQKLQPGCRYAEIVSARFGGSYLSDGLALAKQYAGRERHV